MSANKHQPHIWVLPEDDANRQLANGFLLDQSLATRRIDVLEEAGGWMQVVECFLSDQIAGMISYPHRFMVLLIDFDGQENRLEEVRARIPGDLRERVFVLGCLTTPEALRAKLGSYETIGLALARDCHEGANRTWNDDLLRHNTGELQRLDARVRPFLFREN